MKCIRCNKEFDDSIPWLNAESYGGNRFACPNCGKLYKFTRSVKISVVSNDTDFVEDDWGNTVVPDSKYKK